MTKLEAIYSLSEIEAQSKKAVRGAGFSWGYAEEAAKSVRFLAAHQLPGAIVLAAYLQARDHAAVGSYVRPVTETAVWTAEEDTLALCPILTGACLCDNTPMQSVDALMLEQLAYPLLVVPYLALMSWRSEQSLQLCWEGVELVCHEGLIDWLTYNDTSLTAERAERFTCRVVTKTGVGKEAGKLGQVISKDIWRALDQFAQHTYVPATEESRRGAGPA